MAVVEKILSIFIDESGDFGRFDSHAPYYYVSMVLHDQRDDISKYINSLEERASHWGYPNHAIHTGPLIRREIPYTSVMREHRKSLFNALFHFVRLTNIKYICPYIDQSKCENKDVIAYTDKLSKAIITEIRRNIEYFSSFDKINVYYDSGQIELTRTLNSVFNAFFDNVEFRKATPQDYKLLQAADLICTVEMLANKTTFSKSENDFFHSRRDFSKGILKDIRKKKL